MSGLDASLVTGASVLTGAQAPGGGGGGGSITLVESTDGSVTVTGGVGPTVNLSVPAQFGPDTIIKLPNSLAALVNALELINSLTTSTAGSEVSQWIIKLLKAGAQVEALGITPTQLLMPSGTQANPGMSFIGDPTKGIFLQPGTLYPIACSGGTATFGWSGSTLFLAGNAGVFQIGATDSLATLTRLSANGGLVAGIGNSDFVVGPGGALSPSTSTGFLRIPTLNGIPTAVPTETLTATAATALCEGAGAPVGSPISPGTWACLPNVPFQWRKVSRQGAGSHIASASTATILANERPACDYFHLTGSTAVDFMTYAGSGVYVGVNDGESVTFRIIDGTTIRHLSASPPAGTVPFQLTGNADAVLAAGARICFRLDLDPPGEMSPVWLEMWRTAP